MKRLLTILFCISLFFSFSPFVLAQFDLKIKESDISFEINPPFPNPNEIVSLKIDSFATDLNNATIHWVVNGKLVGSGKGLKQIRFDSGKAGQETKIDIGLDLKDGYSVEKHITIKPSSVDLLWEAETYTPPFFKGKKLYTHQSVVKLVALPHIMKNGVEIDPDKLVYSWAKDGEILGDKSGYGKNILKISTSIISRAMYIDVEVTDPDTGFTAYNGTALSPIEPKIVLYRKDPLYGPMYNVAMTKTYPLNTSEVEILAVPYFFSTNNLNENIIYTWNINNEDIVDNENKSSRIFRKVGDVFGISNISVKIEHLQKILQTGDTDITIDFKKEVKSDLGLDEKI